MTAVRPAAVIVLAAGEGTRMKSATPKVLHAIGGRSLVGHAIAAARGVEPEHLVVVVRHERDRVAAHVTEVAPDALIADQDEVKGTGRAVECGLEQLPDDLTGTVVVTYGDVPLLESATLTALLAQHSASGSAVTVVTAHLDDPTGYGRIVRDADGSVAAIVEQKDATEEQRAITEINSGLYAFDGRVLREALDQVGTDNAQGEKYLTDVLAIARRQGLTVSAHVVDDLWQTEGVNDRVQLATLGKELNRRIVERWMREGVTVVDPATTWIDADVTIGRDTIVRPGVQLLGATSIGEGAEIGPDSTLQDTRVGDGASVVRSQTLLAEIGASATVGPFSYLRPGTTLGVKGKIGGFVETKNAQIGDGAKVPHLTYCGDAEIGAGTNVGAGTIFANYDGDNKHRSRLGRQVFIGSNSVLVAPAEIGDGAFVAAGSAITDPVGAGELAVARGRQHNSPGWTVKRRPGTKAAEAAAASDEHDQASSQEGTTR
ncbi:bifunctional UDP-N-acetylglucosamine diphosphorylase/glucosamine-1-phosphate N-acetyltransferase GlmU [Arsenicicoccus dermatophilus]|uniref:bifunctional UDP-N-acetylglucosamine diphosphorylase/glucosamine-1-phosphate N-acetyltransferase GlmU n=1 Tax=Arsenicicoccus dermatophilus TaxID=1076331 RepID=UPI001F4CAF6F|nr:bifunctional UDP-N-acetylglucosamine diphosphorylase/glucosamine-1-phosphate N-acetyltransferase GlmU [Arsenicicoccus dermatophilus]